MFMLSVLETRSLKPRCQQAMVPLTGLERLLLPLAGFLCLLTVLSGPWSISVSLWPLPLFPCGLLACVFVCLRLSAPLLIRITPSYFGFRAQPNPGHLNLITSAEAPISK